MEIDGNVGCADVNQEVVGSNPTAPVSHNMNYGNCLEKQRVRVLTPLLQALALTGLSHRFALPWLFCLLSLSQGPLQHMSS